MQSYLQRLARHQFVKRRAYEAYLGWKATQLPEALECAYLEAVPVLGATLRTHFSSNGRYVEDEELITSAAARMYEDIRCLVFNGSNAATYQNFLISRVKYAMLESLKFGQQQNFDFAYGGTRPPFGRVDGEKETELKIFLEKIPSLVVRHFKKVCRFEGNERRACLHILSRTLYGRTVVPKLVSTYFSVKRVKFLTDYVNVITRGYLYDIRDKVLKGSVLNDWNDWFSLYADQCYFTEVEEDVEPDSWSLSE